MHWNAYYAIRGYALLIVDPSTTPSFRHSLHEPAVFTIFGEITSTYFRNKPLINTWNTNPLKSILAKKNRCRKSNQIMSLFISSRLTKFYFACFLKNTKNMSKRTTTSNWQKIQECGPRSFEEGHEQDEGNVHTPVLEVMKRVAVKAFFTGGAEYLPSHKIDMLGVYQNVI